MSLANATLVGKGVGGGGGGGWTPPADTLAHFIADDLAASLTDGQTVTSWANAIGNGRDLAEATNPPIYKAGIVNGHDVVRFDGINDQLVHTEQSLDGAGQNDFGLENAYTVSVVMVRRGAGAGFEPVWGADGNSNWNNLAGRWTTTPNDARGRQFGITDVTSGVTLVTGTVYLLTVIFDVVGAGDYYEIRIDGVQQGRNDNHGSSGVSPEDVYLGTNGFNNGNWFNGDIAEILFNDRALSGSELTDQEDHLKTKYGIT